MKAIIDENLPGRLCNWLAARGCIATHVRDIGLASTSDDAVWAHARQTAAVVISRDSDFIDIDAPFSSSLATARPPNSWHGSNPGGLRLKPA